MGYNIEYGQTTRRRTIPSRKQRLLTGSFILLSILLAFLFCINNSTIKDWLIPGDPAVTKAAFSNMVEGLLSGENITDSVTAFCREILDHAKSN